MAWLSKYKGCKNYYLSWRLENGKTKRKTTGTCDVKLANKFKEEFERFQITRKVENNFKDIITSMNGVVDDNTSELISELWNKYEKLPSADSVRTKRNKEIQCLNFIKWCEKELPHKKYLNDLTPRNAYDYLVTRKASNGTKNKYLSTMKSIYKIVYFPLNLKINPFKDIARFAHKVESKKPFSLDEIRNIYSNCDTLFWKIALLCGYYGEGRLGDICELKWSEVDLINNKICFKLNKNKKKDKFVQFDIREDLKELFLQVKRTTNDFVFPAIAKKYNSKSESEISQEFSQIIIKSGLELWEMVGNRKVKRYGYHSLRHSHITHAIDKGASVREAGDSVGHSSPMITEIYNHNIGKSIGGYLENL